MSGEILLYAVICYVLNALHKVHVCLANFCFYYLSTSNNLKAQTWFELLIFGLPDRRLATWPLRLQYLGKHIFGFHNTLANFYFYYLSTNNNPKAEGRDEVGTRDLWFTRPAPYHLATIPVLSGLCSDHSFLSPHVHYSRVMNIPSINFISIL